MDATPSAPPPPPRAPGGARTRLLVDDRMLVVDAQGGTEPAARATPPFGDGPRNLAPRRAVPLTMPPNPVPLVGRATEIVQVERVLAAGGTAILSAGAGYGKTALLHGLAGELGAEYDDGVVLLSARGRGLEDVQFEVFRSFYEAPGRRPGRVDLHRHLADISALLLIDDVADPLPLARALAQAAPYSRVVLATQVGPVGADGVDESDASDGSVAGVEVVEAVSGRETEPTDIDGEPIETGLADDGFPVWLISDPEPEAGAGGQGEPE